MNIKVLRVITRLNIGGPSIQAVLLTKELDKNKFESVLVSGSIDTNEGDMSYLLDRANMCHITILELSRNPNLKNDIIALWKLYLLIKKEKPDIVHTHTAKAGTLGRLAAVLAGVKIKIHTFHGHIFHGYFGNFKTRVFLLIEKVLAFFTSKIIVISKNQHTEIKNILGLAECKLTIIPLGFDLYKFLDIPLQRSNQLCKELGFYNDDVLLVGIVGRLVSIKNHKFFIEIAHKIKDGFKNKVQFLIIGNGQLRHELELQVKDLALSDCVRFLGWQQDLLKIYSGLDVVVLTSLNEGTPVSLIEAMASARPVVASDVGGVSDVVIHEKTGFVCVPGDLDCFCNRLSHMLNDRQERESFGKSGREFVRHRFSKERLIEDIEKLYIEEMRNKGR